MKVYKAVLPRGILLTSPVIYAHPGRSHYHYLSLSLSFNNRSSTSIRTSCRYKTPASLRPCETYNARAAMCIQILGTAHYLCGHSHHYWWGKAKTGCSFFCRTIIGEAIGPDVQNLSRPCNSCVNTGAYYKRGTRWYRRC